MGDRGEWFQSITGRQLFVLDPQPDDICSEDIAWGLSHICRFGGQCDPFYSVAQHSLHVSALAEVAAAEPGAAAAPEWLALIGLLHDATEAYLGDVIRPLKLALPTYRELEERWTDAIDAHYGLGGGLSSPHPAIKLCDNRALATERRDLLSPGPGHDRWQKLPGPDPVVLRPVGCGVAVGAFRSRLTTLLHATKARRLG